MRIKRNNIAKICVSAAVFTTVLLVTLLARPQYYKSELAPPPPSAPDYPSPTYQPCDSVVLPARVQPTIPESYEDYLPSEYAADLRTPSNIKTEADRKSVV